MTLGSSFSKTFASFSSSGHGDVMIDSLKNPKMQQQKKKIANFPFLICSFGLHVSAAFFLNIRRLRTEFEI